MVIQMKKTISMLLAIVVATVAICTLTVCAFADGEETTAATTQATETTTEIDLGRPTTTAAPTTAAPTTAEATTADNGSTQATQAGDAEPTDSSTTSVDDGDTTRAPASVDDDIPATGSGIVVPAVALLALAGGVAVAVKSKKD